MKKFRRFRLVKKFLPVREELTVPVTSLDSLDDEDTTTSAAEQLFRRAFAQIVERAEESFQVELGAGHRVTASSTRIQQVLVISGDENISGDSAGTGDISLGEVAESRVPVSIFMKSHDFCCCFHAFARGE